MRAIISTLVRRYVAGDISLRDFQDWFIPATWDVAKCPDKEIVKAVRNIQLSLAEFSSGDLTEAQLKNDLAAHLSAPRPWLRFQDREPRLVVTSASTKTVPVRV